MCDETKFWLKLRLFSEAKFSETESKWQLAKSRKNHCENQNSHLVCPGSPIEGMRLEEKSADRAKWTATTKWERGIFLSHQSCNFLIEYIILCCENKTKLCIFVVGKINGLLNIISNYHVGFFCCPLLQNGKVCILIGILCQWIVQNFLLLIGKTHNKAKWFINEDISFYIRSYVNFWNSKSIFTLFLFLAPSWLLGNIARLHVGVGPAKRDWVGPPGLLDYGSDKDKDRHMCKDKYKYHEITCCPWKKEII